MSQCYARIQAISQQQGQQPAIVESDVRWTYQTLVEQINALAQAFQSLGITPGERVGVMLYNQKEFLVTFFALRCLGAVVVPINIQMLPKDIGYVIQDAGMRRLVIEQSFLEHLGHVPLQFIIVGDAAPTEPPMRLSYEALIQQALQAGTPSVNCVPTPETELAFLLYTSGTTGHPKGVMLSEHNVLANMDGFKQVLEFTSNDRMTLALPLFHAYGLIVALTGLLEGTQMTLVPKFHPKRILEAVIQEKATILPLVPTLYTVILELYEKSPVKDVSALRFCLSGGAALPVPLLEKIEAAFNAPVIEGYGLTETAPVLSVNDPRAGRRAGSVGKPLPNVQIRIVNDDGHDVPAGEVGEVWAKGENVMAGYYNLPEETAAALDAQGWFKTGDLGRLDDQGYLYIVGRKKDLIIKGGENISPASIEHVLYAHPAVREAAVIGIPHPKLGEDILACVSLKEGQTVSASDLMHYCREQLPPAYQPAQIELMDELPKNAAGKILKKVLKEQLAQRIAH